MTGRGATLRDVANRARVHPSTVSRALNGSTRELVNPATVRRILKAAEALGYEPNSLARSLKTNRTMTVGMLIPDLTNPVFPPIVRGIEDALADEGYTLVLANTDGEPAKERRIVGAMRGRQVDGLLLATALREYPLLDDLAAAGLPVVLVNRTSEHPTVPSVTPDDHAGMGMAVRHLVSLGHTRIAHVAGPQLMTTGLTRYNSFLSWMRVAGIEPDPQLVVFADSFKEQAGAAACEELLGRGADFTAIVAANDLLALGCYDALHAQQLAVPENVSVVGHNDIPFADNFGPPLTTVRIPHYEIGVKAAQLMLEALRSRSASLVAVHLTPSFVLRASTAAPRG
ncbi:MAG: substrate-binding domain-containing protein [Nitriliruptorales bacterium]|nr:substrate-binding domain-containing protein [Nitriliruptorales bacterium]